MVDEAYLRSMAAADDLIDAADVEVMRAVHEALAVEDGKVPSLQQVATAAKAEGPLLSAAEAMADMVDELRQGAAAFASAPGEEVLVAALLEKAAWVDGVRAGAAATLDAARRMQKDELRRVAAPAAAEEEYVIDPAEVRAVQETSRDMALTMEDGAAPSSEQAAEAVLGGLAAKLIVIDMAALAGRLRKGAASFASRPCQDMAVVAALLNKAAAAERHGAEARATVEIFRRYRALISAAP